MNDCMYLNQEFMFKEFRFENVVEISLNSDNMNKLWTSTLVHVKDIRNPPI